MFFWMGVAVCIDGCIEAIIHFCHGSIRGIILSLLLILSFMSLSPRPRDWSATPWQPREKCVIPDRFASSCRKLWTIPLWNWLQRVCCTSMSLLLLLLINGSIIVCMEDTDLWPIQKSRRETFLQPGKKNSGCRVIALMSGTDCKQLRRGKAIAHVTC